jgi:PII-like signaling protein
MQIGNQVTSMTRDLLPAMKVTISIGGDERSAHHPLYREVLDIFHREGISGATLTQGAMSYGVGRSIHSIKNEVTMENLPIIIEAVDEREKIERVAALVAEILGEHGLVEMQPTMLACTARKQKRREG